MIVGWLPPRVLPSWNGARPQLFLKRLDSPDAIALDLPAAHLASISPTGELAILLDDPSKPTRRLARAALTGGAPRAMAEQVASSDWGRQGSDVIVNRFENHKTTIEYPRGHVLYETTSRAGVVRLSPRGDVIALSIHPLVRDTRGQIALLDLEGRVQTLTPEWSEIEGLAWSPSGKEIWFTGTPSAGQPALFAVSRTGAVRTLSRIPSGMQILDVSSDGRVLLATTPSRFELKGKAPGSSTERELSWLDISVALTLSRDGRTLLFAEASSVVGESYAVCVRDMDGSPVVRLGDGIPLDLSPDGKWVLSRPPQSDAELAMLPTGAGERRIVEGQGLTLTGGQWLPDGRRMLVSGRDEGGELRMYVQDVDGSNRRPITPAGVGHRPGWRPPFPVSSDGRWVAAPDAAGRFELYPTEGGAPVTIPGLGLDEDLVCWSEDGRWIYVAATRRLPYNIDRIDWRSGRRERWKSIAPSDAAGVDGGLFSFTMTPDGRAYAYCFRRVLSELYLVEGLR